MADVFDGIPIEGHTGTGPKPLSYLRDKYGNQLTYVADPKKYRLDRLWERSQVEVITIRFLDEDGNPVPGVSGRYEFYGNVVPVKSNPEGIIDWVFKSNDAAYDRRSERGPFTFKTDDGGIELIGLGTPMRNATINHDSMSWDVIVNPSKPVPPVVVPPPGNPGVNRQDLLAIRANLVASRDAANSGIDYIDRVIEGRP